MRAEEGDRCARPPFKPERDHPHVAVALVSRERSPKAKALVRTEPSDAAIWLLPAFSGSPTLGREPT
jgi:hypothetical protein